MHYFSFFIILFLLVVVGASCGKIDYFKGERGPKGTRGERGLPGEAGKDGKDGSSCSVKEALNGAIISCEDGTSVVVLDGQNGSDGIVGKDGIDGKDGLNFVTEIIDPCGNNEDEFDELILRLYNGQLMSYFEQGSHRFLTILAPGNYRTTDTQKCNFTITEDLEVINGND